MFDLIIIGGGPAGITAGIYAVRQRLNTLLITKEFGGQVAKKAVMIENYPGFEEISGQELVQKFEKHLKSSVLKSKVVIVKDEVTQLKKINNHFIICTKSENKFEAKAVIIASGADRRSLKIPGEKEFIGQGVSYCVTCDGPLFSDKTVAVIGGGNAGFEAAIFLSKVAKKIYILEGGMEIKADIENQEKVNNTGKVEIITNVLLKKIQGDKFVKSLVYKDEQTEKIITLKVDGIFVEIGYQPSIYFAKDLIDFNEKNEIKVYPETYETKTPGLFAAGDVNEGLFKQIIIACGEGAKAALSAYKYLQKNEGKK